MRTLSDVVGWKNVSTIAHAIIPINVANAPVITNPHFVPLHMPARIATIHEVGSSCLTTSSSNEDVTGDSYGFSIITDFIRLFVNLIAFGWWSGVWPVVRIR